MEMNDALVGFSSAGNILQRWESARNLMASKQMQALAETSEMTQAYNSLCEEADRYHGIEQLLAIDLVVRISSFLKKEYKKKAEQALERTLSRPPAEMWKLSDSALLPKGAKASEIRENITQALAHASGDWVIPYLIHALVMEETSQRCRQALCLELASRDPNITKWFEQLNQENWSEINARQSNDDEGAMRLRDIASAISFSIKENRAMLGADKEVGPLISSLMNNVVSRSNHSGPSKKLEAAAVAIAILLDEIISSEIMLFTDAAIYSPLGILDRWWQPIHYSADLTAALSGLVRKITSAIRYQSRIGIRSDALLSGLKHSLGPGKSVKQALVKIAESEKGLAPEIDDWLRGHERQATSSVAAILSSVSVTSFSTSFAPLLIECEEAVNLLGKTANEQPEAFLKRINIKVHAIAQDLGLAVSGTVGEITEYNPKAHKTVDGSLPHEPKVKIIRPMVVRERKDGAVDILEKAIVSVAD